MFEKLVYCRLNIHFHDSSCQKAKQQSTYGLQSSSEEIFNRRYAEIGHMPRAVGLRQYMTVKSFTNRYRPITLYFMYINSKSLKNYTRAVSFSKICVKHVSRKFDGYIISIYFYIFLSNQNIVSDMI